MDKALLTKNAPLIVALALTLGMLASFGIQGYRLWQQSTQAAAPATQATITPQTQPRLAETRDVANANLFGQPPSTTEAAVVQTENLPTTNLRLTLRGVSTTEDEGRTSALIEGPDQQTQVYLIGDRLPGDAVLRAVYANRVVIERRGRLENLYFPESSDSSADISTYSDSSADTQEDYQTSYPEQQYNDQAEPQAEEAMPEGSPSEDEMDPGVLEDPPPAQPAYQQDSLSENRRQQIRERLRQLREQMNNQ